MEPSDEQPKRLKKQISLNDSSEAFVSKLRAFVSVEARQV
jgi:hypothetical protein